MSPWFQIALVTPIVIWYGWGYINKTYRNKKGK